MPPSATSDLGLHCLTRYHFDMGHLSHMSRLMTKPTKWECSQWRLRSAWAFPIECTVKTDQTGWMPKLIWVFTGRTGHFVGFVTRRLNYKLTQLELLAIVNLGSRTTAPQKKPYSSDQTECWLIQTIVRIVIVFLNFFGKRTGLSWPFKIISLILSSRTWVRWSPTEMTWSSASRITPSSLAKDISILHHPV